MATLGGKPETKNRKKGAMLDERERDQMWHRIEEHAQRLQDNEQGLIEIRARTEEHARNISDVQSSLNSLNASVDNLNTSINRMDGGMKSLRWIGIALGLIIALVEILDKLKGLAL